MLNLSPHTGTLLDNYTSRNLKLKIHDYDLSYSFIKTAPEKHEVGAKVVSV